MDWESPEWKEGRRDCTGTATAALTEKLLLASEAKAIMARRHGPRAARK
jgi:hypothetical protein